MRAIECTRSWLQKTANAAGLPALARDAVIAGSRKMRSEPAPSTLTSHADSSRLHAAAATIASVRFQRLSTRGRTEPANRPGLAAAIATARLPRPGDRQSRAIRYPFRHSRPRPCRAAFGRLSVVVSMA
jgi:hypothetical protein